MSKLAYHLQQSIDEMDELTGKKTKPNLVVSYFRRTRDFIKDIYYDYPYRCIHNLISMYKNLRFFLPHIIGMRDFDYSYQLNLFCDSLEYLAQGLKRHDHCVLSERNYKRCLFATKRLRAAYNEESYNDKSYKALVKANPFKFVICANGLGNQLTHNYSKGEEYYSKMYKIINKRLRKTEETEKKEAVAYLFKYIQHFWD